MKISPLPIAAAALALGAVAQAQSFILVPDSSADRIVKLSDVDGSVIDANFIVDANDPLTYDFGTPKDVIQVGSEIWVIDQIADSIFRFDQNGAWLATIDTMLDNCRGGAFANGVIYVSNDGSNNGASADSVMMFDPSGASLGSFSTVSTGSSPFDVLEYNGELLVSQFDTANQTGRFDYAGNLLGIFHSSDGVTGIDHPEQLNVTSANTVLAAGFSSPTGIYEYDMSGAQINFYATASLRGVGELGNGLLLFSDSGGIKTLDRATLAQVTILSLTGGQYINRFDFGGGPMTYCTAKVTSNLCVPAIGFNGTPSPTGNFDITCDMVEVNQLGVLFYGDQGPSAQPFQDGFLCVAPPVIRMPVQNSGGTTVCTGSYSQDMTSVINSFPSGTTLHAQYWFRDPGVASGTGLSDGLEFTTIP